MDIPSETFFVEDQTTAASRRIHLQKRILVVDDDAAIRQLYLKVLTGCGYLIDFAEDGEAAWRMVTAEGNRHDLLITDYSMPNLSGVELVHRLRAERMTLPVILVSGAVPEIAARLELAAILSKPFSRVCLLRTVRDVLQSDTGRAGRQPLAGERAGSNRVENHPSDGEQRAVL